MTLINDSGCLNSLEELVATIGFFDGVHLGHRFLIDQVKQKALETGRKSAVVTFSTHPRKVLQTDFQPLLLTTFDEKTTQLASTGIDYCIVLDFNEEMSRLSASEFLNAVLFSKFNIRTLVIGHDHRFGHNRSDGFADYQRYGSKIGIEICQAERYSTPEFPHISSSEIRNALLTGNVEKASALLNYNYCFSGIVTDGFKNGRKIGFPTANITPKDNEKLLPASAVYAVKVHINTVIYNGMMNIGVRPTLQNGLHTSLEVNIFDFDSDIYKQELHICLMAKIRNEHKFPSLETLISQLQKDRELAISILK